MLYFKKRFILSPVISGSSGGDLGNIFVLKEDNKIVKQMCVHQTQINHFRLVLHYLFKTMETIKKDKKIEFKNIQYVVIR